MRSSNNILILCKDPDFLRGYLEKASSIVTGANIIAKSNLEELTQSLKESEFQFNSNIDVCVLDVSAIPHETKLSELPQLETILRKVEKPVLLNAQEHEAFANEIKDFLPSCVITEKYIPEIVLENMIKHLAAHISIPDKSQIRRYKIPSFELERPVDISLDKSVSEILVELSGRFLDDEDKLLTRFESTTSRVKLPETLTRNMPKLYDIEKAIEELKAFLLSASGKRAGRLIVGEKGVGKTTLTHYVAALVAMEDPHFLFLPIDYQWSPFFEIDNRFEQLTEAFLSASQAPSIKTSEAFCDFLHKRIQEGQVDDLKKPSLGVQNLLSTMTQNGGFVAGMYSHFEKKERLEEYVDRYDIDRLSFEEKAHEWLQERCKDPRMLLLYCLAFGLERQKAHFNEFSWERLIASLLRAAAKREEIRETISGYLHQDLNEKLKTAAITPQGFFDILRSQGLALSKFGSDMLHDLSKKGYKIVIFMDNIDARYSRIVEILLLRNSVSFLENISRAVNHDSIMCVRNSTYASHEFIRLDIEGIMMWSSLQIRPPELAAVLKRRIDCLRETGEWIGRSGWFLRDFLYRWVSHMIDGKWPRTVLDIIEKRHPFNVRDQLNLFTTVATSTVIHHRRFSQMKAHQFTSWGYVSPEFCLRALTWGKESFYSESRQRFVPNVFDNGYPGSPFNALTRILALAQMYEKRDFTLNQVIDALSEAGIPKPEAEDAIRAIEKFNLIRKRYQESKDRWRITSWGEYFYKKVWFCLAYVQTVWWDTQILESFSFGPPRLLEWHELREPARNFNDWIQVEEELVRRYLKVPFEDLLKASVWKKISEEFVYSLNSIEKSLGLSYLYGPRAAKK